MKKQIFFLFAIVLATLLNVQDADAQNAENPYVIIVEFTIDEQNVDEAIELLAEMQTQTLENEEGCMVYDVLLSEEDATKIFIYESYQSEDAYKVHANSNYFKEIVTKKLTPLIKHSKITKVIPINQDEGFIDEEV